MLIGLKVVLADSTIVNANQAENPDLYRALKGGGTNFGILLLNSSTAAKIYRSA